MLKKVGKSEYTVHRRADLVAHIGEECRFGHCRIFGPAAGFAQFQFELAGFGNINRCAVISLDLSILIELGGVVSLHPDMAAIGAVELDQALAQIAGSKVLKRRILLQGFKVGHRVQPTSAQHLLDCHTDLRCPSRIDVGQFASCICTENSDGCRLGQQAEPRLAVFQLVRLLNLQRNIADVSDGAEEFPVGAAQSLHADFDVVTFARFVEEPLLESSLFEVAAGDAGINHMCCREIFGMQECGRRLAEAFLDLVAGQCFPCGIEARPATIGIGAKYDVSNVIENFLFLVALQTDSQTVAVPLREECRDGKADREIRGQECLVRHQLQFRAPANENYGPQSDGSCGRRDCRDEQRCDGGPDKSGAKRGIQDQRGRKEQEREGGLREDEHRADGHQAHHDHPFQQVAGLRRLAFAPRAKEYERGRQDYYEAECICYEPSLPICQREPGTGIGKHHACNNCGCEGCDDRGEDEHCIGVDLGEIERCVLRLAHQQNKGGNLDRIRDRKPQRDAPVVANQTIDSDVREQTSQDVEWRGARPAIDEPCGRDRIRQP